LSKRAERPGGHSRERIRAPERAKYGSNTKGNAGVDDHHVSRAGMVSGSLYVVATPIGNLGDLSSRAVEILREADLIACEDTRHSAALFAAHGIRRPSISYFEHNEKRRIPELIERVLAGGTIALVSDAGTPAISDPGYRLVSAALEAGIRVVAVPGPSAAIAALSISGLPSDRFTFEGFLSSREGERLQQLRGLRTEPRTMIFYEAARRLANTLAAMAEVFGDKREAVIVREISKTFEETIRGTVGALAARIASAETRGEITLLVGGASASRDKNKRAANAVTLELLREAGLSLKQASAVIAKLTGASRREIYQRGLGDSRSTGAVED
jgi:16S rRNA (cytidine1402-2'-O)-methyltransferase